jgi:hypothetical protein
MSCVHVKTPYYRSSSHTLGIKETLVLISLIHPIVGSNEGLLEISYFNTKPSALVFVQPWPVVANVWEPFNLY